MENSTKEMLSLLKKKTLSCKIEKVKDYESYVSREENTKSLLEGNVKVEKSTSNDRVQEDREYDLSSFF